MIKQKIYYKKEEHFLPTTQKITGGHETLAIFGSFGPQKVWNMNMCALLAA